MSEGRNTIIADINGVRLSFKTSPGIFSPNSVDRGTLCMLRRAGVHFSPGVKVLDLGCGYGAVGVYAATLCGAENVTMTDIDSEAVRLAAENAVLNGLPEIKTVVGDAFKNLDDTGFDIILSNPPYHADFSVPKEFIEKSFNRLKISGKLLMVIKRDKWYKNKFTAVFGGVSVTEEDGYFVFCGEKRSSIRADKR